MADVLMRLLTLALCCLVTSKAHVCSVGNEQNTETTLKWVTVSAAEPCDCSMIMLGGVNIQPVQHKYQRVHTKQPLFEDDPDAIKRLFNCDKMDEAVATKWIEIASFVQSEQKPFTPNLTVLGDWKNLGVQQVNISVGSRLIDQELVLTFDARGCNNTSWFAYDRLLNSPWPDLDPKADFKINWEDRGNELLGIHSTKKRGDYPVSGWFVFARQNLESILQGEELTKPVVAFGKQRRVDWIDRDVLSHEKEASQSSTSSPAFGHYGVDLKPNTRMSTDYEFMPWWTVDMGKSYCIESLVVSPCEDGKKNVIGAQFRVSKSRDIGSGDPCGAPVRESPPSFSPDINIICEDQAYGQYLSLSIEEKHGILGFCELSAFARTGPDPTLAGQQTWQSSVLTHNASASVDGVLDFTCSQTNVYLKISKEFLRFPEHNEDTIGLGDGGNMAWWMVDLGDSFVVTKVLISPFPDLNEWTKLKGAHVSVSEEPFSDTGAACGKPLRLEDLTSHTPLLIDCLRELLGRYVFIEGSTRLSMCEVEIFGRINGNVAIADTIRIQALVRSE